MAHLEPSGHPDRAAQPGWPDPSAGTQPQLVIENLAVSFATEKGVVRAVDGVDLAVSRGGTLGLVGESGCGKSVTCHSILGLTPPNGRIAGGRILFEGRDLLQLPRPELARLRGHDIAMIFQDPMSALNPVHTVGGQITESLRIHRGLPRRQALEEAAALLDLVGIPEPRVRLREFPHQLSGGMCQRVMIAMALACRPKLLIADEPTTALDVTIQAQILDLLRDLQGEFGMSIILITHDLGVVAEMADTVAVMYCGRVVETAPAKDLFANPSHPYTRGLINSLPRVDRQVSALTPVDGFLPSPFDLPPGCPFEPRCAGASVRCRQTAPSLKALSPGHRVSCHHSRESGAMRPEDASEQPLLEFRNVVRHYGAGRRRFLRNEPVVHAVNGVSLGIRTGETVGLVGESGCGKSTLARLALGIDTPTDGEILFRGRSLSGLPAKEWRGLRRSMQMIFQDPSSALDPRMSVGDQIREPLAIHRLGADAARGAIVDAMIDAVGLPRDLMSRFPHELSGGQQQRVVIARALVLQPTLLVCDEPISALDVSVQAQVVNLLRDLQRRLSLTYLFISHDLAIVRHICDRIAVMYLGEIVELADRDALFDHPRHPYTQALISAIPIPDPTARRERRLLRGDPPNAIKLPSGCGFHTRCPHAEPHCRVQHPALIETAPGHRAACHLATGAAQPQLRAAAG